MNISYGFVSTYPPTRSGPAVFAVGLYHALVSGTGDTGRVVRLVDAAQPRPAQEVVAQLVAGDTNSMRAASAVLNECDVAIVQHELPSYGAPDGFGLLTLLDALQIPSVVVLHSVPAEPTAAERAVLEGLIAKADAVVVMAAVAGERLAGAYAVDMGKVSVIPHGADAPSVRAAAAPVFRTGRPTVLTWGLLAPGKGIEWGIDAFADLRGLEPAPRYLIVGQTNPQELAVAGETYRTRLAEQVRSLGLGATVQFDGHYHDEAALAAMISLADVVLLPNDSTDQVSSGVLTQAVAAGRPIVATRFPQAVEMLGGGAGLLVPHGDRAAIAAALRSVLTRPDVAAGMIRAAAQAAEPLRWPAVADRYREVTTQAIRAGLAA